MGVIIALSVFGYLLVGGIAKGIWKHYQWHTDCYDHCATCKCPAKWITFALWPAFIGIGVTLVAGKIGNKLLRVPEAVGDMIGRNTKKIPMLRGKGRYD
jgi:hypothetical protein